MRDGIPLSLPDGQTPLDWLDLETIGEVEVIRGTAAALYGNAAGGVVSFRTREAAATPLAVSTRAWNGGGLTRISAQLSGSQDAIGPFSKPDYLLSYSRTSGDGAREWSKQESNSFFILKHASVGKTRVEFQGTYYDTPRAENTGALTAAELEKDPSLPDSLNITKNSYKAVTQTQVALTATRGTRDRQLSASVFGGTRSLDNPLPFSIVGVDRNSYGGILRGTTLLSISEDELIRALRLSAGADAQWQRDDRANWENCFDNSSSSPTTTCPTRGEARGAYRLNQLELINGFGSYARAEAEMRGHVFVSGALRYDNVNFELRDRFITSSNADDSGERSMSAISPLVGVVWRMRPLVSLYANYSTAFETPTITELTNQPDGSAGLNGVIDPQRTRTVEAGMQGYLFNAMQIDLSAFSAQVRDELLSFDVPGAPGRRAFRNAGKTRREGLEANVRVKRSWIEGGTAYTWSYFRFDEYSVGTTDFAGKRIPGIPENQLQIFATVKHAGLFGTLETIGASRVTANDAGTVFAPSYFVWNARLGYNGTLTRNLGLSPIIGIDNIFDRRYASSVVTNATRGRFYEPGAAQRVYAGMSIDIR